MKGELFHSSPIELSPVKPLVQRLTDELVKRHYTVALSDPWGILTDTITITGSTRVFHYGTIEQPVQSKNAFEHAIFRARELRSKRKDTCGVCVEGDLAEGKFVIGFDMAGRQPWNSLVVINSESLDISKRLLKWQVSEKVFSDAILYINNQHEILPYALHGYSSIPKVLPPIFADLEQNIVNFYRLISKRRQNFKISTVESCTGGALANALTDVSSHYVSVSGVVAYDEETKMRMVGVPIEDLVYGQVYSRRVAKSMAKNWFEKTQANIVVAITGTMENFDTRPYHTDTPPGNVFVSILIEGGKELGGEEISIHLKPPHFTISSREEMKIDILRYIIGKLYEFYAADRFNYMFAEQS